MNIIPIVPSNGKDPVSTLGFTDDQLKAYHKLIEFIDSPYNPNDYKRALIGYAGTGKTYLTKSLIKNCKLNYSLIGLAAPTHKAARVLKENIRISNVKINTIASDLGLKPNYEHQSFDINNPPFDTQGKIKIGDYKVYIVDESSMVSRSMSMLLEKVCKTKGCKIIYIGDDAQLPPVSENYSSALRGLTSFKLSQIVRQDEDNPIRYLLNLLRYDIQNNTFNFLTYISKKENKEKFDVGNTKGYRVCDTREFGEKVLTYFTDEQLTKNVDFVKIVAYTNDCVSSWNKFIRYNIIEDAETSVITKNDLFTSYLTVVNQFNDTVIINSEDYILHDVVNYVHPTYELQGFLVKFTAICGGKVTTPLFILNHKDLFSVDRYVKLSNNLIESAKNAASKLKAQRWREYFAFKEGVLLLCDIKKRIGDDVKTIFSRNIDYGFAITAHKSQGSTYDTCMVDVNDICFDKYGNLRSNAESINRMLYVACSRAKNKLYLKFGN